MGAVSCLTNGFLTTVLGDIFGFIWRTTEWVNRRMVTSPPNLGGLGLYAVQERLQAMYVKHIADFVWGPPTKWRAFAFYFLALPLRRWNPELWDNHSPHGDWIPPCYVAAISAFKAVTAIVPKLGRQGSAVKFCYSILQSASFLPARVERLLPAIKFSVTWRALATGDFSPDARNTLWRAVHNILPVRVFLARFKIVSVTVCPLCQTQSETVEHLFAQCAAVRPVWARIETLFHLKLSRTAPS